jgi:elongation factor P hydroxylase
MIHAAEDLILIFNRCFEQEYQTRLEKSPDEPWYLPKSDEHKYHRILFAHGFFSSALHEISHWMIAGPQRRLLEDYGYWYEPDGRSIEQQRLFEQVEVKPQALEWILSQACQYRFQFSLDNLNGETGDISAFKNAVMAQVNQYCLGGLPKRAEQFRLALCQFYETSTVLSADSFLR